MSKWNHTELLRRWNPAASSAPTLDQADLCKFIEEAITQQNHLALPAEEIRSIAGLLAAAKTRKEIFDWSSTLMLGESFAVEVMKRQEKLDISPGSSASFPSIGASATPDESSSSSAFRVSHNKRRRAKGKALSAATELVGGTLFECGCFATTHPFKSNCANCGRVFCQQEDDETCYYCGLQPSKCFATEVRMESGKIDEATRTKNKKEYEEAVFRRNQLLQFAKERAKRTVVIDDQSGQFCATGWSTKEERDAAAQAERERVAQMHRNTGAYVVHLDISNENICLGASEPPRDSEAPQEPSTVSDVIEQMPVDEAERSDAEDEEQKSRCLPMPALLQKVWYEEPKQSHPGNESKQSLPQAVFSTRVQNEYFEEDNMTWNVATAEHEIEDEPQLQFFVPPEVPQEGGRQDPLKVLAAPVVELFSECAVEKPQQQGTKWTVTRAMKSRDDRMCLSLHQPWASLVMFGIKVHEGRTWPTDYRGRLWIHAGAHPPTAIDDVERHYRAFVPHGTKFPSAYPTRCLLGYVYIVDCLDAKRYKEEVASDQRSEDSEFALVLKEPVKLTFPLAMEGKPKIFQLEKKLWQAARRQLEIEASKFS